MTDSKGELSFEDPSPVPVVVNARYVSVCSLALCRILAGKGKQTGPGKRENFCPKNHIN